MKSSARIFQENSALKSADIAHKQKLQNAFTNYAQKRNISLQQFSSLELARSRAGAIRHRVIENLEKYLIEFESNFIRNGGKLIWARDAAEAMEKISEIIAEEKPSFVIKSKSMVTEEIGLNDFLSENCKVETIETDLGEFIQQLAGESPYHIVTPCIHKTREEINKLLSEKINAPHDAPAPSLAAAARLHLRNYLRNATVGISGANFLIADTGSIAITENEGNAFFSASASRVHIAITGVEKILPSVSDLELFWPLLATHGTGQQITTYNHLISGPDESEGPQKFFLVLIDNGRSEVLEKTEQRSALACIRCGACYNVCPVYKNIGGHSYGNTYGGPIGSIITPLMKGEKEFGHLSHASSLCGACTDICPVKIDLHKLLLYNRRDFADSHSDKLVWVAWKKAMLNRKLMDKGGALAKNTMLKLFFKKLWGKERELPKVADKSFNQLMRERLKKGM